MKTGESKTVNGVERCLNLRVGEWVEVRSLKEILATLDKDHGVEGLPFSPEMARFCGKKFRVYRSAHKTADTIELFTIRRMANAVHLEELRCDGSSHGGCQAECLLFWKECWLKRIHKEQPANPSNANGAENAAKITEAEIELSGLMNSTRCPGTEGETERYRCQATEILKATTEVRRRDRWNPLFYVKDITSGNVSLSDFVRYGVLAMLNSFLLRWFGWRFPRVYGLAGDKTPSGHLNLQPGELVRVRTKREIMKTLNGRLRNRGLHFDVEMVPFCGKGDFRVLRRVDRILNERTGEMMTLPNPCIVLDGVTCGGNLSSQRMFSRRHEHIYWREIWLQRASECAEPARAIEWVLRLARQLEQCPRGVLISTALLMVGAIGYVDYITGFEASYSAFYLPAIGFAGWFLGRGVGVITSVLSVAVSLCADLAGGASFSNPLVTAWNGGVLMSLYFVVVWLVASLRALQQRVEARVHAQAAGLKEREGRAG